MSTCLAEWFPQGQSPTPRAGRGSVLPSQILTQVLAYHWCLIVSCLKPERCKGSSGILDSTWRSGIPREVCSGVVLKARLWCMWRIPGSSLSAAGMLPLVHQEGGELRPSDLSLAFLATGTGRWLCTVEPAQLPAPS